MDAIEGNKLTVARLQGQL